MRVGLVLGGGGLVGMAYHAAALTALEHDLGWDPRTAEVIVGTSAGAVVGSLLRAGVPASDLAALAVDAETRATPTEIEAAMRRRDDFPDLPLRALLRLPRPPSPALVASWLRRPWRVDPVAALVAVMADGRIDLADLSDGRVALGDAWPEQHLWICAVRRHDLRRVVFGRDQWPPLPTAVMASCAVPGCFAPVMTGGHAFIDGGVRSPTNADVLRRKPLDLVIVVSPMSARELPRFTVNAAMRRYAKKKVDSELAILRRHGIASVLIEPGAELAEVLGHDLMRQEHDGIVIESFLDAGDQLRQPWVRRLLAELSSRRSPSRRSDRGRAAA